MRGSLPSAVSILAIAGSVMFGQVSENSGGLAALVVSSGVQFDGPATEAESAPAPSYGTATRSAATLVAHAFHPIDSGVTYAYNQLSGNLSINRTNAVGSVWLEAPVHLPSGVLVESAEFRICDTSATKGFFSFLTINDKSGTISQPGLVTTTNAETPGCINRTFTLATPIEIDNDNKAYSIEVNLGGNGTVGDDTIVLSHARLYYRRQVSPAPVVATFADVPTSHPFFRFIQALAAAGITGGCGGGMYCPDNPVTRGQMAVFLSIALGLHFPD